MKTSEFDYDLPAGLIAQEPPSERGTSRMMVVHRQSGTFEHRRISDLPEYLDAGDLLVVNNTKVFPARIFGHRQATGGKIELLLVEEVHDSSFINHHSSFSSSWDCFLKARSRPKVGEKLELADGKIEAIVLEVRGERITAEFFSESPLFDILEEAGYPPVPPYIKRDYSTSTIPLVEMDKERYQTVYAEHRGSVAAPTAGLHFTDELLDLLSGKGVGRREVTLHVGPGTFKPVSVETLEEHVMESERYSLSGQAAGEINSVKSTGGRIVAVGSTTVRTLETAAMSGSIEQGEGRSTLFIYPPYEFKVVDVMLTNFHLPKSSLIMMVSALAGRDLIFDAYKEAIKKEYRFYSYGDCMLIL